MRTLEAINPRTGSSDGPFPALDRDELSVIAARLRAAAPAWSARSLQDRAEIVRSWAVDAAGDDALLLALIEDTGRKGVSALERAALPASVERWADWGVEALAPPASRPSRVDGVWVDQQFVPYGLVGFITPWNSPLGLSFIDAIPALIAGCTAIIKPSEVTPRFVAPLIATIARHPQLAEVLAIAPGDGITGSAVIDLVDAVCFTGSVATGRRVAVQCANRLIPAFLELGGKDPSIVLKGADLDRAALGITWSGTMNTGQTCHAAERVYVHRSQLDAFIERLIAAANAVTVAYPSLDDGTLGPFIDPRQAAVVTAQMQEAIAAGATIAAGGLPWKDGGWWMRPTVLTSVTQDMRIMREETFAPLLPVIPFDDVEEAIAMANDTEFGLSASVWGPEEAARAVAERINAGGLSINDVSLPSVVQDGEKVAFGVSGLGGTRMGRTAIRKFVRPKALLTNHNSGTSEWWN